MSTYKIIIDENNNSAKLFLEYMKSLPFISFVNNNSNNLDEDKIAVPMSVEEFKDKFGLNINKNVR